MHFKRFTNRNIAINFLLVILFILWNNFIGDVKVEHYAIVIIWLLGFYLNQSSQKFVIGFSLFFIFLIIYDSLRFIPNYEVSVVHIKDVYEYEKAFFGINFNNVLYTPNEYLALHTHKLFDFLSGLFYINWLPVPIAFAIYLYFRDKYIYAQYAIVFLFVNIFGFIIYYIYPTAPPWYVEIHGFELDLSVLGYQAGLGRFDDIVGIPIFENMYSKNANVFAAIPSLHVAYPTVAFLFALKKGMGKLNWFFGIFMIGVCASAVYSVHHYVIDVIMGIMVTLFTYFLFSRIFKLSVIKRQIDVFIKYI